MSEPTVEQVIQAASRMVMGAALDALQVDPHSWSARPCPTCRLVTAAMGRPFGCDKYRIDNPRR